MQVPHLNADDLQIYCSGGPLISSYVFDAVNDDMERIYTGVINDGLVLNARKSQALLVHLRGRNPIPHPLFLSDEKILPAFKVENLSFIFDETYLISVIFRHPEKHSTC